VKVSRSCRGKSPADARAAAGNRVSAGLALWASGSGWKDRVSRLGANLKHARMRFTDRCSLEIRAIPSTVPARQRGVGVDRGQKRCWHRPLRILRGYELHRLLDLPRAFESRKCTCSGVRSRVVCNLTSSASYRTGAVGYLTETRTRSGAPREVLIPTISRARDQMLVPQYCYSIRGSRRISLIADTLAGFCAPNGERPVRIWLEHRQSAIMVLAVDLGLGMACPTGPALGCYERSDR